MGKKAHIASNREKSYHDRAAEVTETRKKRYEDITGADAGSVSGEFLRGPAGPRRNGWDRVQSVHASEHSRANTYMRPHFFPLQSTFRIPLPHTNPSSVPGSNSNREMEIQNAALTNQASALDSVSEDGAPVFQTLKERRSSAAGNNSQVGVAGDELVVKVRADAEYRHAKTSCRERPTSASPPPPLFPLYSHKCMTHPPPLFS